MNQYGSPESGFAGVQFEDPSGNLIEIAGGFLPRIIRMIFKEKLLERAEVK